MLINEVENIVGISKKSIRYYEEEGLLIPKRNDENYYRIYNNEDIRKLKVIKFLRELGVPIREIKLLNNQEITLQECLQERINKIEKEEEKYQKIKNMCLDLSKTNETFTSVDITKYLNQMNILNKEGFTLRDIKSNKNKKIRGAIISSVIFSIFFVWLSGIITYFQFTEQEKMPWIIYGFLSFILIIPVISIIYNLVIRIKEIKGGEEDEASKY